MTRPLWLLTPALALAACTSLQRGAQEQFSNDFSCPVDAVQSRERSDLKPSYFESTQVPPAPSAIAADPARLAVWNKNHTPNFDGLDSMDDVYEARGCDGRAFYRCHHPSKHSGRASCSRETSVPSSIHYVL